MVVPIIYSTILFILEIYSNTLSYIVKLWISTHFFVSSIIAVLVPTTMWPSVAPLKLFG